MSESEAAGDALFDFLSSLPKTEGYTDQDRYRDFRRVFLGSGEGKRVLREILRSGRVFHSSIGGNPVDPLKVAANEGRRQLALMVLSTLTVEPPERPVQTKRKP